MSAADVTVSRGSRVFIVVKSTQPWIDYQQVPRPSFQSTLITLECHACRHEGIYKKSVNRHGRIRHVPNRFLLTITGSAQCPFLESKSSYVHYAAISPSIFCSFNLAAFYILYGRRNYPEVRTPQRKQPKRIKAAPQFSCAVLLVPVAGVSKGSRFFSQFSMLGFGISP